MAVASSSLAICTAEWMLSGHTGVDLAPAWFPRLVAEQFIGSARDGDVDRAPDPLPFIAIDLVWTNSTDTAQHVSVAVHRSSRSIVVSNPNTIALDDATSWDVGVNPKAPRPSATRRGMGGRVQVTRPSNSSIQFSRLFADRDDGVFYEHVGQVLPDETLQFRYACLYSTPGAWRVGGTEDPRHEAYARWARVRVFAAPMLTGSV
jgi:hypothetical protein